MAGLCITSAMAFTNAGNYIFPPHFREIKSFLHSFLGLPSLDQ